MKSDKQVCFGVIGAGRIGKIHIENLKHRIPGAKLVAVSDVFPEVLQKVAKRFGISDVTTNYCDLLKNADIEAVVICSPTDTHTQIIKEAAEVKKHIFCEKPIDLSLERIKTTIDFVAKHKVKFQVGFNRRFDPNFKKVYDITSSGKIGQPQILKITSRDPNPPTAEYINASGGIFLDMTIHDFDMARYLVGSEVTEVYARGDVMVDPVFQEAGDFDTVITLVVNLANSGRICRLSLNLSLVITPSCLPAR